MRREKGFTLIELMVVVAILGLLSAVLVPNIISMTNKAKASKIVSVADTLSTGCAAYNMDMGTYATEYSGTGYLAPNYHQLSLTQTAAAWKGPYIKAPVSVAENPNNGYVYMYANLGQWQIATGTAGFDFNNDGTQDTPATGNFVAFGSIPNTLGILVNAAVDGDRGTLAGAPASWSSSGKCEWTGSVVSIYLAGA